MLTETSWRDARRLEAWAGEGRVNFARRVARGYPVTVADGEGNQTWPSS